VTINRLQNSCLSKGFFTKGWLIIDEINMLDTPMWAALSRVAFCPDVRFILVGDWNQFLPIDDRSPGRPVKHTAEHSD